jgi:hypothetical protein
VAVVSLVASCSSSSPGSDAASLARADEPEMTRVVFINEEPPYEWCEWVTGPPEPRPINPPPPAPAPDAVLPFFDAPLEDALAPADKPCKCVYWDGAAWHDSPADKTSELCVVGVEDRHEDRCVPNGNPSTITVPDCEASGTTTCEATGHAQVLPDNAEVGHAACAAQPASACGDVTYTGTARGESDCEFCKYYVDAMPPNPEPNTDYYEWKVSCVSGQQSDVVSQDVTQRCHSQRVLIEGVDAVDGWNVVNLCEACTLPCPAFGVTCQVQRWFADEGCTGMQYKGKCVPTGSVGPYGVPDPSFTPVPIGPQIVDPPGDAGVPDAPPSDGGVMDAY